jgi:predicted nucleotidyltransferase
MKTPSIPGQRKPARPSRETLKRLAEAIVSTVHPLRIILFGSAARGEMNEHSDLDLLVVMPNGVHRNRTCDKLYLKLRGIGFAKDIIVVTEGDVALYADNPYTVIHAALREGWELYHAA